MIGLVKKYLQKRSKDKAMRLFSEKHKFRLHDDYGFSVDGKIVSEFGYLLSYISGGKHKDFYNFENLCSDYMMLSNVIYGELLLAKPRESEAFGVSPETAKFNLKNLQTILDAINEYVLLAKDNDLPLNPLMLSSK